MIFLKSFLDADIVITNGSEVSHETLEFIKEANKRQGVIILTDPDYPGLQIRNKINSYTTGCKNAFVEKSKAIKGKKVGIVDDVVSLGQSLAAVEKLVNDAGGIVCGKMFVLAEGDAANRDDIIYLERLPLFDKNGKEI